MVHGTALALLAAMCLLGAPGGQAVNISKGKCPPKPGVENFDISKFAGHWYQQSAYSQVFEAGSKCSQANYTPDGKGGVKVRNTLLYTLTKKKGSIEGSAVLANPNAKLAPRGELLVTLNVPVAGKRTSPLNVLATDYDNYAIVYSCSAALGLNAEAAWVLTRKAAVTDPKIKAAIDAAVAAAGLDVKSLKATPQDCGELA